VTLFFSNGNRSDFLKNIKIQKCMAHYSTHVPIVNDTMGCNVSCEVCICQRQVDRDIRRLKCDKVALLQQLKNISNAQKNEEGNDVLWECLTNSGWIEYDRDSTQSIETDFANGKEKHTFALNNISYVITFTDMKQRRRHNCTTERTVRRIKNRHTNLSSFHSANWSLPDIPLILNDETEGVRIKEINRTHLNAKLTRELYEYNLATGHYYNSVDKITHLKPVCKIWVIEYLPHHPVMQSFNETRTRFYLESKSQSKKTNAVVVYCAVKCSV
jgi:hypothetical protein